MDDKEIYLKQLQWFPGHMAKGINQVKKYLPLINLVVIVLDARIPQSSMPTNINNLFKNKKQLILLNKADLADSNQVIKWEQFYKKRGFEILVTNLKDNKTIFKVTNKINFLLKDKAKIDRNVIIIGIPNVGKSTLINKLINKKRLKTENRPGVTKSIEWVNLNNNLQLLDTPGILLPKFDDKNVGLKLALINAIKRDILPIEDVIIKGLELLLLNYQNLIIDHFKIQIDSKLDKYQLLDLIANKYHFYLKNNEIDYQKTFIFLHQEFNNRLKINWDYISH